MFIEYIEYFAMLLLLAAEISYLSLLKPVSSESII